MEHSICARLWKREELPRTSDKTPFIRRNNWNEDKEGGNGTNMTLLAMRRNTVIMCKCNETPVMLENSRVPCIIIMCKCEDDIIPSTDNGTSSGDT